MSFQARVAAAVAAAGQCGNNTDRRLAYCKSELLRIDLQESDTPEEERRELESQLDDAAARLSLKAHVKKQKADIMMILHLVGCFIYMAILGVPLLGGLVPLRWLGTLLRKFGGRANSLPADMVQRLFTRGFLCTAGVVLCEDGLEHLDTNVPRLVMFAHASNIDPFLIGANAMLAPKFVGKRVLFMIPLLGWAAFLQGHIPINRSSLASAKQSFVKVKKYLQRRGYSVAIAPEGTRSGTGQLLPFKKGPFHVAREVGLATQPAVFFNNYDLWPPGQLFTRTGLIMIRYLPAIPYEECSIEIHQRKVRRAMLESLQDVPKYMADPKLGLLYRRGTMGLNRAFLLLMLAAPVLSFCGMIESAVFLGLPHMLCRMSGFPIWSVIISYCGAAFVVGVAALFELRHEGREPCFPESPGAAAAPLQDARNEAR